MHTNMFIHFQRVLCRCCSGSIPPHWVCRICFATTPDIMITGNTACVTCFSTLLIVPIAHSQSLQQTSHLPPSIYTLVSYISAYLAKPQQCDCIIHCFLHTVNNLQILTCKVEFFYYNTFFVHSVLCSQCYVLLKYVILFHFNTVQHHQTHEKNMVYETAAKMIQLQTFILEYEMVNICIYFMALISERHVFVEGFSAEEFCQWNQQGCFVKILHVEFITAWVCIRSTAGSSKSFNNV